MIRLYPAQEIEVEEIREMLIRIWWDTYRNLLSDELIQEAIDKWFGDDELLQQITDQKYFFYLVKDDLNRLAGLVTATLDYPDVIHIIRLYVNPDCQRMGIGKQMMDAAIKAFPNGRKLRLGVIENNPKGFPFYMKQGFQIAGKEVEQLKSGPITVLIMEKDIESR